MKYSNKYNLPQSLVDVIVNLTYDLSESDPYRVSVTTLINPPIQRLLTVRHWNELEEDVSEHIWRIVGSAYHYILAKTKEKDRLIEEKLAEEVNGITIVGKLDLYEDKNKSIEDYKITSVWNIKFAKPKDYEPQLNLYAWLLRKAGFTVEKAFINYLLRDWRKKELQRYDDYPPIPFKRIGVKLWSFEEQQKFIEEKVNLYKSILELADDKLPICSAEERWKKEDSYAVYKNKNKTASRVLKTDEEAKKYIINIGITKDKYRIEKRKGMDNKCIEYCLINKFCPYWREHYATKT